MTTNVQPKMFPGLNCSAIEFFIVDNQVKALTKGKLSDFEDLPYTYHQILKEALSKELEASAIVKEWHPNSEIKQLEQFVKCRFGGLDFVPDIKNMELQHGEYWDCPLRGICKGEGIVCRSLVYNGNVLSAAYIKLMKLISTNKTNENLFEEMAMCEGTFNKFKKELYEILGVQTKQEVACIAKDLNLI